MIRHARIVWMLMGLAACTPADEDYCNGFGVSGSPEYGKCLTYYRQQTQYFEADRGVCALEADKTYPRSLYDTGGFARVYSSPLYWGTPYYGSQIVDVPPDYAHNAELDRLRMRIIAPCMQMKGWNSGASWQAGRHAVKAASPSFTPKSRTGTELPWRR